MRHFNYSHLLYFWTVARDGSIAKASQSLHLTPQTISGQLKLLEGAVGGALFNRVGRRLELSDLGRLVYSYANEIFSVGIELAQIVKANVKAGPTTLNVGITDSVPKLIAYRLLEPALTMDVPPRMVCGEGRLEVLLGELAIHQLDVVISDSPLPSGLHVRAYNHILGETDTAFFAVKSKQKVLAKDFPRSLDGHPMLMPAPGTPLRRSLDEWFDMNEIHPRIVGEFDDSALLNAFGEAGAGVFPGPTAIERVICRMYNVAVIGRTHDVRERFFVISSERRIKHPAVLRISEQSREHLFAMNR